MGAVLAWLDRRGGPVEPDRLAPLLTASRDRAVDGQATWASGPVALAYQRFSITPEEEGERQPLVTTERPRLTLCADLRLDNRDELIERLEVGEPISDAGLLIRAYRRWGIDCVRHLLGDFTFVLWDGETRTLFAARDPLGARGLCYTADADRVVMASEVRQLLALPGTAEIDLRQVRDYLCDTWSDPERSFFRRIVHCPPGHWLRATADTFESRCYWRPDPAARVRYRREQDYAEHFRQVATEAVRSRLRSRGPVAISLSGGLDSSTVTALAARELRAEGRAAPRCFSYVFDELEACDERRFIEPVLRHHGLEPHLLPADHLWPLRDLERWPSDPGFVFSDPYASLAMAVADAAGAAGCRVLLTGHFGDMLFAGGVYWAEGLLRELRLVQLLALIAAHRSSLRARSDLVSHGLLPVLGVAGLRQRHRRTARARHLAETVLHPDLLRATGRGGVGKALSGGGDRRARLRALFCPAGPQGAMAARGHFARHGVERLDPLADRRLVELALALPADQLARPGRHRWVLRNAMVDLLPETVRERRHKTGFLPLFARGLRRERDTVRRLMTRPEIVRRGFVRGPWLESQLEEKSLPDGGYLLFKCLSLELWLRRHH